jgi:dTDP-4-amino-4,6-dideoxygalactose transaminase
MIPRGRIDISYSDITRGIVYCIGDLSGIHNSFNNQFENEHQLICLSVRTGFDLLLTAMDLPPGSEIIVSNISIPDMFAILAARQLVAIPVHIDKNTLNTSVSEIRAAISTKTKAILITHLFGAIADMDEIIALADRHQLVVIEDGAQAYSGPDYRGHPKTDVVMQSFGMIKTNTALSGALVLFNNADLAGQVIKLNANLPEQPVPVYLKKLVKAAFIKLLTTRWIYSLVYKLITVFGKDIDPVLSGFTKGFPGKDVFTKIRFRANTPLKRLLIWKLKHYPISKLKKRERYAKNIFSNIPSEMAIGSQNIKHSHWVLPLESNEPDQLILYLRQRGFDATSKASSLVRLPCPGNIDVHQLDLEKLVYLPAYPSMSPKRQLCLINYINQFSAAG